MYVGELASVRLALKTWESGGFLCCLVYLLRRSAFCIGFCICVGAAALDML